MNTEIVANIHIHTKYSDGEKMQLEIAEIAARNDLDVIFITDHNIYVEGFDKYYDFAGKKVLLITGEEIHDINRIPQKNHLLTLGVSHSHSNITGKLQDLINKISKDGGLTFIAHGFDPALPAFGEEDLSWADWSVEGFTGLELWNNLSEFKIRVKSKLQGIFYAFFPDLLAKEPPVQLRKIWDRFLKEGKKVVAIGGSDAHTLIYKFGPFIKEVFPYRYHFRTINTHILLPSPRTFVPEPDSKIILRSLKSGNAFIANDHIKPSKGFCFYAELHGKKFSMGEEIFFRRGLLIHARLPFPAKCFLIRNGTPIIRYDKTTKIDYPVTGRGVYRLECYRNQFFRSRGWIFSNPIYIS